MKKIYVIIISLLTSTWSFSQNIDGFLEGGVENGSALLGNYMRPAFEGLGYALNSGWYNTGKPHKLLGFDITFGPAFALVPESRKFSTFDPSQYTNMGIAAPLNPNSPYADRMPTMFGPNLNADDLPFLVFNEGTADEIRVTVPTGIGLDEILPFPAAVPGVYAQVGIGLIKNTDVKLRLLPQQKFDGFTTSMFGIGVMHDVKQWIPGLKLLPFDLSGFFAFSRMNNSFAFDESDPNKVLNFNVNGTTFQGIISKKLALLTVYGGLGYMSSSTDFNMKGEYEIQSGATFTDPISIKSNSGSMRANVGMRIKILVLTISAEYAIQEYNTLTAGIGIAVR